MGADSRARAHTHEPQESMWAHCILAAPLYSLEGLLWQHPDTAEVCAWSKLCDQALSSTVSNIALTDAHRITKHALQIYYCGTCDIEVNWGSNLHRLAACEPRLHI